MCPNNADWMANSVDLDQTASSCFDHYGKHASQQSVAGWFHWNLIWLSLMPTDVKKSAYRKIPKYSDTWKIAVIILKFQQCGSVIK